MQRRRELGSSFQPPRMPRRGAPSVRGRGLHPNCLGTDDEHKAHVDDSYNGSPVAARIWQMFASMHAAEGPEGIIYIYNVLTYDL